jgi:hypothetical protein
MTWWQQFKSRFGKRPPVIMTEWGPVTESPRRQAAENMKNDPVLRAKIEQMCGEKEARRRFPEAYEK